MYSCVLCHELRVEIGINLDRSMLLVDCMILLLRLHFMTRFAGIVNAAVVVDGVVDSALVADVPRCDCFVCDSRCKVAF